MKDNFARPADTSVPHPPDGCPQCIHGFGVVPYDVIRTDREGVRCWYRCPRCRHSWWTGWGVRDHEWTDPHNFPGDHDERECPCGCGLRLLRTPARLLPVGGAA